MICCHERLSCEKRIGRDAQRLESHWVLIEYMTCFLIVVDSELSVISTALFVACNLA